VLEQADNVCETTVVQDAWARGQNLTVHALIYRLSDGLLRDLGLTVAAAAQLAPAYASAIARLSAQHADGSRDAAYAGEHHDRR
jgi:carbonic anhydrase